ncbi:MAG: hypothetical protein C0596_06870 [Marinilabiliales bacterium]|nr:MAG: hypothetical protein C0596_06870 [Marinilabiliales bacterium]
MPTIHELTERYSQYTDEELMEIHEKIDEYSDEAKAALTNVINAGGGIGALKDRIFKKIEIEREIRKIEFQVSELFNGNADIEYMKKHIHYNLISDNRFNEIIENTIDRLKLEKADKEIKLKTIVGGLTGGAIGGTLGGVLWGIQMIYTGHMYFIIVFGLAVL